MVSEEVKFLDACGGQKHKVAKALSVSPEAAARDSSTIVYNGFIDLEKRIDCFILTFILRRRLMSKVEWA